MSTTEDYALLMLWQWSPLQEVAEKGGQRGVGHSPDEMTDRFSLKYCSSPEGARLPQRSSSRESNSNASGHAAPLPMTTLCKPVGRKLIGVWCKLWPTSQSILPHLQYCIVPEDQLHAWQSEPQG